MGAENSNRGAGQLFVDTLALVGLVVLVWGMILFASAFVEPESVLLAPDR